MLHVVPGANMPVNCWGPSVGAKAISYKTAVILGLLGQAIGMLLFGPESYSAFNDYLNQRQLLSSHPLQTMYSLMWSILVPLAWQILAIWRRVLLPTYFATGNHLCHSSLFSILPARINLGGRDRCNMHIRLLTASLVLVQIIVVVVAGIVGAALVFPGPAAVNFGHFTSINQLNGLAADATLWTLSPAVAGVVTSAAFIIIRGAVFRGEDVFHQVLWVCWPFQQCMTI